MARSLRLVMAYNLVQMSLAAEGYRLMPGFFQLSSARSDFKRVNFLAGVSYQEVIHGKRT